MVFKVRKESEKPQIKLVSFRLPNELIDAVNRIAEDEEISVTRLVKQMLEYCVTDYEKTRK